MHADRHSKSLPPPTGLAPVEANIEKGRGVRRTRFDSPPGQARWDLPPPTGTAHHGFTIIELLTVLTIMLIVLSIASLAAIDWARTTGMRTSVTAVEAGLIRARQHAVTQRQRTWFFTAEPGQSPAWFAIETEEGLIGTTNTLRRGIAFHHYSDTNASFTVRGSVDEGRLDFVLTEPHRGERAMSATVTVYGVTGHTEVSR